MVHPAARRAALAAVTALGIPVDLGLVFPPKEGEHRGRGTWMGKDLKPIDIADLLPWAAAGNARGGAVYIRPGPACRDVHPGIVLLDDLDAVKVAELTAAGFEPCLVIETSHGNVQAWVRLVDGPVEYAEVHAASQSLARRFGGDPRATSPMQPGRLPGFLNRKDKHRRADGTFPFVKLIAAHPGRQARAGPDFIRSIGAELAQRAGAAGAPETPRVAAHPMIAGGGADEVLDLIYREERQRILSQLRAGRRPLAASSESEIDFATVARALSEAMEENRVAAWLSARRPDKGPSYAVHTLAAGREFMARKLHGGMGP